MWVIFALLDPDPDPLTRLNPDPIRFRIRIPQPCLEHIYAARPLSFLLKCGSFSSQLLHFLAKFVPAVHCSLTAKEIFLVSVISRIVLQDNLFLLLLSLFSPLCWYRTGQREYRPCLSLITYRYLCVGSTTTAPPAARKRRPLVRRRGMRVGEGAVVGSRRGRCFRHSAASWAGIRGSGPRPLRRPRFVSSSVLCGSGICLSRI